MSSKSYQCCPFRQEKDKLCLDLKLIPAEEIKALLIAAEDKPAVSMCLCFEGTTAKRSNSLSPRFLFWPLVNGPVVQEDHRESRASTEKPCSYKAPAQDAGPSGARPPFGDTNTSPCDVHHYILENVM